MVVIVNNKLSLSENMRTDLIFFKKFTTIVKLVSYFNK